MLELLENTAVETIQAEVEEEAGTAAAVVDMEDIFTARAAAAVRDGSSLSRVSLLGGWATHQMRHNSV